jgi:hypothetical protein
VLIAFLLSGVVPASALDQPLRGYKMSLVRAASGNEKLVCPVGFHCAGMPGGPGISFFCVPD